MARYAKAVLARVLGGKRQVAAFYSHIYKE